MGGLKAHPFVGNYVSGKHGMVGLMRTLAVELAEHSIRVNSVHPGVIETPMVSEGDAVEQIAALRARL